MALCIRVKGSRQSVKLPCDDYIFHALLTRGPVVSKPNERVYVEAYDGAAADSLVFHMSLLEASAVMDAFPAFEDAGLVASWKLSATTGLVTLIAVAPCNNDEQVRQFLMSSASAEFVRSRYEACLGPSFE